MNKTGKTLVLLAGVALAAAFASTAVAFKFGWETGYPWLGGWFYSPLDAWRWWNAWGQFNTPYGLHHTHRGEFLKALASCAPLLIVPAALVHFWQMHGRLPGTDPTRQAGMGTVEKLLKKTGHIARTGNGVVLGVDPGLWPWQQRTVRDNGDGHVLIEGPSRMGKGAGNVIPTLLSHRGPVLASDPKDELNPITGRLRASLGPVFVVNPTDPGSAKFNPLLELRGGVHRIGDCQMLAESMTSDSDVGAKDPPFWRRRAADLLCVLLLHVVSSDDSTLGHLWRLMSELANDRFPKTADPEVLVAVKTHRATAQNTRDGIEAQLASHLSFLRDPLIRHMTSSSDFRAGDLQASERPVTVFLSPPVSDGRRLRPLMRLMLESIVSALTTHQRYTADGREKRHDLLGLIDEFPQLGRMSVIEDKMPIMAGYGVRLCLVCQSVNQISSIYGQRQSITDNCLTRVYIPGLNPEGVQAAAKLGGDHAVAHSSKQMPFGLRGTASMSQSETRVSLLEVGEMIENARDKVLIFIAGTRPTYLKKLRYWREREFKGRWDVQGSALPAPYLPLPPESVPVDAEPDLAEDEQAMLASIEELLKDLPAVRKRLSA